MAKQGVSQAVDARVNRKLTVLGLLALAAAGLTLAPVSEMGFRLASEAYWGASDKSCIIWWNPLPQLYWPNQQLPQWLDDSSFRKSVLMMILIIGPISVGALLLIRRVTKIAMTLALLLAPTVLLMMSLIMVEFTPRFESYLLLQVHFTLFIIPAVAIRSLTPELVEPEGSETIGGVHRYPWRTWLIFVSVILSLASIETLTQYLSRMVLELLNNHFRTWDWLDYRKAILDEQDFASLILKHALHDVVVWYLLPMLLFVLLCRLKMRPWMGWFTGLFYTLFPLGYYYLYTHGYWIEQVFHAIIMGQYVALIFAVGLMAYHAQVRREPPREADEHH